MNYIFFNKSNYINSCFVVKKNAQEMVDLWTGFTVLPFTICKIIFNYLMVIRKQDYITYLF